jgi:predicted alpha/beta-hydrolase family hydrolase
MDAKELLFLTPRGVSVRGAYLQGSKGTLPVVLAPGSGYHAEMPLLRGAAEALKAQGHPTLRFDWAYSTRGQTPSPDFRNERQDLAAAVEEACSLSGAKAVYLVGKSLGARLALELARSSKRVRGVVLLTFPLHAPQAPSAVLHVAELPPLPVHLITGDQDPLCQTEALRAAIERGHLPPKPTVLRGDHSLLGSEPAAIEAVVDAIRRWEA